LNDDGIFSITNSILGHYFVMGDKKDIIISYDVPKAGSYSNTLVIVAPRDNCDEIFHFPITINAVAGELTQNIPMPLPPITICNLITHLPTLNDFPITIGDTIMSITEITGPNSDMFS